jgi:hypothetical protein
MAMANSEKEARAEQRRAYMERDYDPGYTPSTMPAAEHRVANALDYIAYQLGQINRKLDRIIGDSGPRT